MITLFILFPCQQHVDNGTMIGTCGECASRKDEFLVRLIITIDEVISEPHVWATLPPQSGLRSEIDRGFIVVRSTFNVAVDVLCK